MADGRPEPPPPRVWRVPIVLALAAIPGVLLVRIVVQSSVERAIGPATTAASSARAEQVADSATWSATILAAVLVALAAVDALRRRESIHGVTRALRAIRDGTRPGQVTYGGPAETRELAEQTNRTIEALVARDERVAREENERRTILSGMAEGIVGVDKHSRVVLINAAALRMLDAAGDDLYGRPLVDVTRVPEVLQTVQRCLEDSKPRRTEVVLPGRRSSRVLEVEARSLTDESRGTLGCVLVLHDLSQLRRLEKVRQDFVANVSHELKTPLTSMRAYVETVLDDPQMEASVREGFLEKALVSTNRLSAIVSDLLSIARLESDEVRLDMQRFEFLEVVESAAKDARGTAEMRSVSIELAPLRQATPVLGDREALRTAVSNLIDNAIKYSPESGVVRLALEASAGRAVFSVSDQGPGIPVQEQERIFERFYRVDKNRSRELGGTGLGLSIVRNVMRRHRGDVRVESVVGRGSTFRLELPLAP